MQDMETTRPKFELGRVLITPNAQSTLDNQDVMTSLRRHVMGDWGDVCPEDREENDLSLMEGFRILSVYHGKSGTKFWIITEADRAATTVLLPSDY